MRTRFGGIEEILRGREGSIGRPNRRAPLELIVAVVQKPKHTKPRVSKGWLRTGPAA